MSYFYVSRTECSIHEYHNVNVVLYTSLGGVVVPPGEMLIHRRLTPQNYVFEKHYTPGQRKYGTKSTCLRHCQGSKGLEVGLVNIVKPKTSHPKNIERKHTCRRNNEFDFLKKSKSNLAT